MAYLLSVCRVGCSRLGCFYSCSSCCWLQAPPTPNIPSTQSTLQEVYPLSISCLLLLFVSKQPIGASYNRFLVGSRYHLNPAAAIGIFSSHGTRGRCVCVCVCAKKRKKEQQLVKQIKTRREHFFHAVTGLSQAHAQPTAKRSVRSRDKFAQQRHTQCHTRTKASCRGEERKQQTQSHSMSGRIEASQCMSNNEKIVDRQTIGASLQAPQSAEILPSSPHLPHLLFFFKWLWSQERESTFLSRSWTIIAIKMKEKSTQSVAQTS